MASGACPHLGEVAWIAAHNVLAGGGGNVLLVGFFTVGAGVIVRDITAMRPAVVEVTIFFAVGRALLAETVGRLMGALRGVSVLGGASVPGHHAVGLWSFPGCEGP